MSINKPLKIKIRTDVALRDTITTMSSVLTTIGNRIGDDFSDTIKYPAIESNSGEITGGIISAEARKLTTPLKLILSGDVTGSVIFDGSEGSNDGVVLNNSILNINGIPITNIFDTDGFVNGSNILGKTKVEVTGTKTLTGKIGDTNLSSLFEYNDTNNLVCKKSTETTQFDDFRYIKLKGDLTGGLRNRKKQLDGTFLISNGSKFIKTDDPEFTVGIEDYSYFESYVKIQQYIPTTNKLGYKWKNPFTNVVEFVEEMTTDISAHLNAVTNFVYEIPVSKFEDSDDPTTKVSDKTFFMVQPNVNNVTDYNTYSKMNMVVKYDTDNKWKIYCYTNDVVPNMKLVKILRFGKIENRS